MCECFLRFIFGDMKSNSITTILLSGGLAKSRNVPPQMCAGLVRNFRLGSTRPGAEEVNHSYPSAGEDPGSLQVPPLPFGAGDPPDVWKRVHSPGRECRRPLGSIRQFIFIGSRNRSQHDYGRGNPRTIHIFLYIYIYRSIYLSIYLAI